MEQTRLNHFDLDGIDGDGQSPPNSLVASVGGEPEEGRPFAGVIVGVASVVVSLAHLLWGTGQLVRAMLR